MTSREQFVAGEIVALFIHHAAREVMPRLLIKADLILTCKSLSRCMYYTYGDGFVASMRCRNAERTCFDGNRYIVPTFPESNGVWLRPSNSLCRRPAICFPWCSRGIQLGFDANFFLVASYLTTICLVPDVNQQSNTMERHYPYAQAWCLTACLCSSLWLLSSR